jgi:hypothetical protein
MHFFEARQFNNYEALLASHTCTADTKCCIKQPYNEVVHCYSFMVAKQVSFKNNTIVYA